MIIKIPKGIIFSTHFVAATLLANQESYDEESYDEMQAASDYIDYLEDVLLHVKKSSAGKIVLNQHKEWRQNEEIS